MEYAEAIQQRASLLKALRAFFDKEGVVEVDTPLLYPSASPDPYLKYLTTNYQGRRYFLQSSPEFAMKRLLVEHPVSMFQICKAFRDEEFGKRHLVEFTMLEWYMVDWDIDTLMQQVFRLLSEILQIETLIQKSYADCFMECFDVNPHTITTENAQSLVKKFTQAYKPETFTKDECLHLLFAEKVEAGFDSNVITIVFDFPASQCALASSGKDAQGFSVAKRFEVFYSGLELANAYQEEQSPEELRQRFEKENQLRREQGMQAIPIDENFLKAMELGMPACSGIALGIERLLMAKTGLGDIRELQPFIQD